MLETLMNAIKGRVRATSDGALLCHGDWANRNAVYAESCTFFVTLTIIFYSYQNSFSFFKDILKEKEGWHRRFSAQQGKHSIWASKVPNVLNLEKRRLVAVADMHLHIDATHTLNRIVGSTNHYINIYAKVKSFFTQNNTR